MTWFLKNKIRKQIKLVNELNQELIEGIRKYNELVAEHNAMNNFVPIMPQQQPQQAEQNQADSKMHIRQIVTKGGKIKEIPDVVEL